MPTEAPVCHLPPIVDVPQPAPTTLPAIPQATSDPESLLAAIQALTAGYNQLAGMLDQRPQSVNGVDGQPGAPGQKGKSGGNWTEQSRQVKTIRVFNPNDKTQFVDVQVINQLVMIDQSTSKTWTWNR
jgi:hypothetical protein